MWTRRALLLVAQTLAATHSIRGAPNGFPESGNGLWYDAPGVFWGRDFLPVGNGYLAAMTPGGTTVETTQLNLESLWSGGPFQNSSYNGGNKLPSDREATRAAMDSVRSEIFASTSGTIASDGADIDGLIGAYAGAGYLFTTLNNSAAVSGYARWLDLDQAIARTTWTQGDVELNRTTFCSHPAQACVQQTSTSVPQTLTYAYSVAPETDLPPPNVTCLDDATLQVRGYAGAPGMLYEILFRVLPAAQSTVSCAAADSYDPSVATVNATLSASGSNLAIIWVGDTEYSMDAGDEAHGFSFRGDDPHDVLLSRISSLQDTSVGDLLAAHLDDVASTLNSFKLDLGQSAQLDQTTGAQLDQTTGALLDAYQTDEGNPYLEWLLFNFGRYLLWSSARGALPANLQGKWAQNYASAWSADANINIQMNIWCAELTGLDVSQSMFDYMEKTWVPRGTQTAQNLYNIDEGWTTHNEMNIFGHTGMKLGDPQWANYPEANAWMMLHVWDHFDYTNDVDWWKAQGYPLLKGVAQFHFHKLIEDQRFNDSSLVVAPCNSPEQKPVTLGCAHAQQLIWQLFNAVDKGFEASGDQEADFLTAIRTARDKMDKGIHIGSWGQLQEWKVDMDDENDTHRHLSHLIGLYPGYALASYNESLQTGPSSNTSYTKEQVINASTISLTHRGNGTGPDGDAGWEKMWRAAAWAQLGDAEQFYHELTYAIATNFAENLFSVYNPGEDDPIFQIDANLGHPAAVLNALIQAPDTASYEEPLVVTLLPALPQQWAASGFIKGARLRGGLTVDFSWKNGKLDGATFTVSDNVRLRDVRVVANGHVVKEITTEAGLVVQI
ncbi:glycoside hydrolase family 95 protein [Schizophyllum commune Tattone D]|nr:glycoside hydrolase family 95 protein [Schizophyllum commune Tattone D]